MSAWAPLALAGSFLTVLPLRAGAASPRLLGAAVGLFPAVGLALGVLLGGLGLALDAFLPAGAVAAALLAASVALTGALHLDGLMDTADGAFGGDTPARRLEIMRDSRVGAFGATAGALALLAQYACLAELTGFARLVALAVALTAGRWAMVLTLSAFPAARLDGLGAAFRAGGSRAPVLVAGATVLAVAGATGRVGVVGVLLATGAALLGGRFLVGRLGGVTGDTHGALAVVAETLALYAAVALGRA